MKIITEVNIKNSATVTFGNKRAVWSKGYGWRQYYCR